MNYSSASISSVEVPDKSQALKWISRLTCLHRAGLLPLPQRYSPTCLRLPSPSSSSPLVGDKCLTEAIRAARALTDMWQCDTRPRHWWITLPHQSAMPPTPSLTRLGCGRRGDSLLGLRAACMGISGLLIHALFICASISVTDLWSNTR